MPRGKAGEANKGIVTLRAQYGKVVSSSKEKKEILVLKRYRNGGTPTTDETFDVKFEKEINASAEAKLWWRRNGKTVVQKTCRRS